MHAQSLSSQLRKYMWGGLLKVFAWHFGLGVCLCGWPLLCDFSRWCPDSPVDSLQHNGIVTLEAQVLWVVLHACTEHWIQRSINDYICIASIFILVICRPDTMPDNEYCHECQSGGNPHLYTKFSLPVCSDSRPTQPELASIKCYQEYSNLIHSIISWAMLFVHSDGRICGKQLNMHRSLYWWNLVISLRCNHVMRAIIGQPQPSLTLQTPSKPTQSLGIPANTITSNSPHRKSGQ